MNYTTNFTREELILAPPYTSKGVKIDNTPTIEIEDNLIRLSVFVLQPLKNALCKKYNTNVIIYASCGYRCPIYNADIGGDKASEHLWGLAADITAYYFNKDKLKVILPNQEIIDVCIQEKLPYQKIIDEQLYRKSGYLAKWIHISIPFKGTVPNLMIRTARNTEKDLTTIYKTIKVGYV